MNTAFTRTFLSLCALALCPLVVFAQATAFTYQGRLADGAQPAAGTYDFRFGVCDSPGTAGPAITVTNVGVAVAGGLFTTVVDFGMAPDKSGPKWLEIGVRTNGGGDFVTLNPRQMITATPFALFATNAGFAVTASNLLGALPAAQLTGNYPSPVALTNAANAFAGTFSGSGAALTGVNAASLNGLSATGFIQNTTSPQTANLNITGNAVIGGVITGNGSGLTGVNCSSSWQMPSGTFVNMTANISYLITNSSHTVLLLPAAPNLGEVFRVVGGGGGDWAVSQNANQVILANFLPQSQWNKSGAPTSKFWNAIASSADGVKLVACAGNDYLYTSINSGQTWVQRSVPQSNWVSVASSTNGVKLVAAVGYDLVGGIHVSTNSGVTWTQTSAPITNWYALASSADGSKLVAVVGSWVARGGIYTSANSGGTWTQTSAPATNWQAVASSADGVKLVAAAYSGNVYVSADSGGTWTATTLPVALWAGVSSSADGNHLVALAQGAGDLAWVSADAGATWQKAASPAVTAWSGVVASADGRRVFASTPNSGVFASQDYGMTWMSTGAPNDDWWGLACSADGSQVAALDVSTPGGIYTYRASSTTPGIYGYLSGTLGSVVELQYIGNNRFICLSQQGVITAY